MSLNSEIKTIIESLTPATTYIRAATLNEANEKITRKAAELGPVAIHAALPTITNTAGDARVTRSTPVQVLFLELNSDQDEDAEAIDNLLESTKALADQFFDKLSRSTLLDPTVSIDSYTLEPAPMFDDILTGWQLTLDFPEVRTVYYCA